MGDASTVRATPRKDQAPWACLTLAGAVEQESSLAGGWSAAPTLSLPLFALCSCCHPHSLKEDGEGHVAGRLLVTFGSAGGSGSSGRLGERLLVHDSWSIEEPLEVCWA